MINFNNILLNNLYSLYKFLGLPIKRHLIKYLMFVFLCSISEVLVLSLIVPVVTVLTSDGEIQLMGFNLSNFINSEIFSNKIILLSFAIISLISLTYIRVLVTILSSKLTFDIGKRLVRLILTYVLHENFSSFIVRNSSNTLDIITNKSNIVVYSVIYSLFQFINSFFIGIFLLSVALYMYPLLAFSTFSALSFLYFCVVKYSKWRLNKCSDVVALSSAELMNKSKEALGSFRDIKIGKLESYYISLISSKDSALRDAQASIAIYTVIPKYLIEGFALIIVLIISYIITLQDSRDGVVSLFFILVCGQRLLPILQQIYSAFVNIFSAKDSLVDVINILKLKPDFYYSSFNMNFSENIIAKNISYRYEDGQNVLININFTIKKGEKIVIVGDSGSGKSTILDILLGLIYPVEGSLEVDGTSLGVDNIKSYQHLISQVPQNMFLINDTIINNIILNKEEVIDFLKLNKVLNQSQLSTYVNSLEMGVESIVSENGSNMSGGQRQRIGIARALYKDSQIIILDEATSSLDANVEYEILKSLLNIKDLTLICVTHRLEYVNMFDKKFAMHNGTLEVSEIENI